MSDWNDFLRAPGDATFGAVYHEFKALAWTVCRRHLKRDEDAEEAFQLSWARLVEDARAGRIARSAAAREAVCRAAGREADALRKRLQRRGAREVSMENAGVAGRAVANSAVDDAKMAMTELVARLPDELRVAVELHYLHGLTHREVAAALGVSQATVHSRLKSALKRLKPMAERGGLRESFGVLAAGGLATGLMLPPSSLDAAPTFAELAKIALPAAGLALAAKIAMVACACAVVVAAIAFGAMHDAGVDDSAKGVVAVAAARAAGADDDAQTAKDEDGDGEAGSADASSNDAEGDAKAGDSTNVETPAADLLRVVSVVATDAQSGEPVRGARVEFESVSEALYARGREYERHRTTDASGVARVEDAPRGRVTVEVFADGYANAGRMIDLVDSDTAFAVDLSPGATIFGTVSDDDGTPVVGARVSGSYSKSTPCDFETQTDAQGSYEIPHVAFAEAVERINVSLDGYESVYLPEAVVVPAGVARHRFDMTMKRATMHRGVVVSAESGAPIPNARIHGLGGLHLAPIGVADESGRFALANSGVRDGMVMAAAKGFAPGHAWLDPKADTTIRMSRGWSIAGRVVDEQGNPVKGASASVSEWTYVIPQLPVTDDGTFDIRDMPKGAKISFGAPGYSDARDVATIEGQTDVVVTMTTEGWLAGNVVGADTGVAIVSFNVRVDHTEDRREGDAQGWLKMNLKDVGVDFDDPQGEFRVGPFIAGSAWALVVSAEGYADKVVPRVVARAEVERKTVTMEPAHGRVEGTVADAGGAPVAKAVVTLIVHRKAIHAKRPFTWTNLRFRRDDALSIRTTETAADGTFAIEGVELPMGGDVVVEAQGHERTHVGLAGTPEEPLAITLSPAARLRIVVDRKALPKVGTGALWVTGMVDREIVEFPLPRNSDVHEIEGLAPGHFLLSLHGKEEYTTEKSTTQAWSGEVDLRAGETTEVRAGFEERFTIAGWTTQDGVQSRVMESGSKRLGQVVLCRRVGGRWVLATYASAEHDGAFKIEGVPPGDYFLSIRTSISSIANPGVFAGKHRVRVDSDMRDVAVEYMPTAKVRGTFGGDAQNRQELVIVRVDGDEHAGQRLYAGPGEQEIDGLEPGTYEVRDAAGGTVLRDGIVVSEGVGEVDLGLVALPAGADATDPGSAAGPAPQPRRLTMRRSTSGN